MVVSRRNPATRGIRWPFRVQHFDDRPQVRSWGDQHGFMTADEAIRYVLAVLAVDRAEVGKWRVREGRRTIWP
jgi:hypothetical protein